MRRKKQAQPVKSGFTMVEFSLASAFVAVLLITISGVVMNITEIYRKGLTLKTVNSVGRSVVDEIEDSISGGGSTVVQQGELKKGEVLVGESDNTGALCAGKYTYIWNKRDAFRGKSANPADVVWSGGRIYDFKLVKISDSERLICQQWSKIKSTSTVNLKKLSGTTVSNVEDLLNSADIELYVYSVSVTTVTSDTVGTQAFIAGKIQLGSDRETTKLTGAKCENADEANEYCALNEFKFAARTAGKGV